MTQETTPAATHNWTRKSKTLSICTICRAVERTVFLGVIPDDCDTDEYSNRMRAAANAPKQTRTAPRRGRCEDCGNLPGYGFGGRLRDPNGCECTSGY